MGEYFFERLDECVEKYDLDFFYQKKTEGNLEDFLNSYSDEQLKAFMYLYFSKSSKGSDEISHKEKVRMLSLKIKDSFEKLLKDLSFHNTISFDKIISTGVKDGYSSVLINIGWAFINEESDEYSVPDDLKKIYLKIATKKYKKEKLFDSIHELVSNMFFNMGIIPKDLLSKYFDKNLYGLMTWKQLDNMLENYFIKIYNGKEYYVDNHINFMDDDFDDIKDVIYFKRTIDDYKMYSDKIYDVLAEIYKIITGEYSATYKMTYLVLGNARSAEDIIDSIKSNYRVTEKKLEKISEIIYNNFNELRFWDYGAKTIDEATVDLFILDKKPKSSKYSILLNSLSDDAIDYLSDNYSFDSKDELKEMLLNYFNDFYLKELMENDLVDNILECDLEEYNANSYITKAVLNGVIFLYKDMDKIKVFIPEEIEKLLINCDGNSTREINYSISNIIQSYIAINGAIKKDKLHEILKEDYHIDLPIKEMDEFVKDEKVFDVLDDYYCVYGQLNEFFEAKVLPLKEKFGKYRIINLETDNIVTCATSFISEVDEYLNTLKIDYSKIGEFISLLHIISFTDYYTKENLEKMNSDIGLDLSKVQINKVHSIIDKYKNDIPIWTYNGYTKKEVNSMPKEKKVGRNEPCPCGSGKKYKKCCGK